jgi:hypothetical protein
MLRLTGELIKLYGRNVMRHPAGHRQAEEPQDFHCQPELRPDTGSECLSAWLSWNQWGDYHRTAHDTVATDLQDQHSTLILSGGTSQGSVLVRATRWRPSRET